jgi:hypothetical protein
MSCLLHGEGHFRRFAVAVTLLPPQTTASAKVGLRATTVGTGTEGFMGSAGPRESFSPWQPIPCPTPMVQPSPICKLIFPYYSTRPTHWLEMEIKLLLYSSFFPGWFVALTCIKSQYMLLTHVILSNLEIRVLMLSCRSLNLVTDASRYFVGCHNIGSFKQ